MSALEFAAAIKWPITVLILAAMATVLLKRSPDTRKAVGGWFSRRNFRFVVGGQEFEASVAATEGSLSAAISPDLELADAEGQKPEADAESSLEPDPAEQEVENARRSAVGTLAQNAVRLGWLWGRGEQGGSQPLTSVTWDMDGNPSLRVMAKEDAPAEFQRLLAEQQIQLSHDEVLALRAELRRRGWWPSANQQPAPPHPRQERSTDGGDAVP